MVILVFTAFFGLCQLFLMPAAQADFIAHSWEEHSAASHEFKLDAMVRYLSTHQNYDSLGSLQAPSSLKNASRTLGDFTATYGFEPRWSLYARLSWAYNRLESSSPSPATQFGLGDQSAGITFQATPHFHFQFQLDFPAYGNSATSKSPSLGDGSTDVTLGGFAKIPIAERKADAFTLIGGLGYTKRSKGFSSQLPWSALFSYEPKGFGFGAQLGIVGLVSLKTDARSDQSIPSPAAGARSGGSFLTGAINPSLASLRGTLNYHLPDEFSLTALCEKTVWGQAAPESFSVALGLSKTWGNSEPRSRPAAARIADLNSSSSEGWVQYAFQAKVLRANDQIQAVRIDKGSQDGVLVGQVFDIFQTHPDGTIVQVIARARVTSTDLGQATLSVKEYYKEVLIEAGFLAKRPIDVAP